MRFTYRTWGLLTFTKENLRITLDFGFKNVDLSLTIIQNCLSEHFCLWVDEVLTPLLKNQENIQKFPSCIGKGKINH